MVQNAHNDVEWHDVDKVNNAIEARAQNNRSLARRLLEEVVANAPRDYVYSYEEGDRLFIKFWDRDEFVQYVTGLQANQERKKKGKDEGQRACWIRSAYPRAYYHLACIDVEEGKYESALTHLEASLELEPDQPLCFCEIAVVHCLMEQHELAIRFYDKALQARLHITAGTRALALRGKGFQLVELGELDLAEMCFRESLQYEPSSTIALDELSCIAHLRSRGGSSPPSRLRTTSRGQDVCAVCGRKVIYQPGNKFRAVNIKGRVLYLCSECSKKHSKPWWQFWK